MPAGAECDPHKNFATAIEDAERFDQGRLADISGDAAHIGGGDSGARRAGFTSVDLAQVVTDVAEFYEPLADEKGISLGWQRDGIAATLPGDPSLLFEAVGNLVDNAIKFTPSGGRIGVRILFRSSMHRRGGQRHRSRHPQRRA